MFTINIYIKFAIIAATLIGGTVMAIFIGFWYAFPFLLIGVGFLISYLLLGTVQSAAELMQKMEFEECEKRLDLTFKPNWLYKTNKAFFYIIKGSIAMNLKNNELAEEWFIKAQGIDLPSDNEKAMVLLQLANINATKNKWTAAQAYYRELKKLTVTEKMIKEQISQFDKALQNRGQSKAASRQGFRGFSAGGGKRRRPKSR